MPETNPTLRAVLGESPTNMSLPVEIRVSSCKKPAYPPGLRLGDLRVLPIEGCRKAGWLSLTEVF